MKKGPPRYAQKILISLLRTEIAEEVLGDLEEKYWLQATRTSRLRASIDYWYQVINYVRPFAIRKLKTSKQYHLRMYTSYIKVGWRHLLRNRTHALINIGGLALGMTVALLIGLWIYDELTFNNLHKNHERIGRVMRNGTLNGETLTTTYQPFPLAEELREKYGSHFKNVAIAMGFDEHVLSRKSKDVNTQGQFVEPGMLHILSLTIVEGSLKGFNDPHAIVISSSLAKSLFGVEDPLEKEIRIDNTMDGKVIAVYEDIASSSSFSSSAFLGSWEMFMADNDWIKYQGFSNNMLDIYAELQTTSNFKDVNQVIKDAILNRIVDNNKDYAAVNPQIFIHPMDEWHLWNEFKNGKATGGLIQFVWMFGIVGVFVLLLACINFVNLSTARSEKRAREVGIRKAMGSVKSQLISQFFSEAFVVVSISLIISFVIVVLSLPLFNDMAGKNIQMPWTNGYFWSLLAAFTVITTLMAGSYPAFYLSSFQPVKALKGLFRGSRFAGNSRKVLVVIQFTVSVTLIIGTAVVYQQIQHARNRESGYDTNGLVMVSMNSPEFVKNFEVIRTELKKTGVVEEIAQSGGKITQIWASNGGFNWPGKDPAQQAEFATLSVAPEYGGTVGWNFVNGRDFSKDMASDSSGFVISEGAVRLMNLKDPLGQTIHWEPGWSKGADFRVIGVIKDVVMGSPFGTAMPAIYYISGYNNGVMNIRLVKNVNAREAITVIKNVFHKIIPAVAFDFKFADVEFNAKFAVEERIGQLASVFATLAIGISCLGLIGLSSFIAEQRMKEMSIRKVLGASVSGICGLLSKDFVVLVLIASLIAIPLSSYFLNGWLSQYAYRIEIPIWLYVVTTFGALLLTLITISFQTFKVAYTNPSKTLKSE
ncbi:MAG: ABC transporter permease [Chryseolinea sp.]